MFQKTGDELAVVVDEHGGVEGIVTLTNLVEWVVGDLERPEDRSPKVVRRDDGSWLVDGSLPISDLTEILGIRELPGEETAFTTLAGFVLAHLKRIPAPSDYFVLDGWRFEVVDMDKNRVDKILIQRSPQQGDVGP
jgi:putative hemolysin